MSMHRFAFAALMWMVFSKCLWGAELTYVGNITGPLGKATAISASAVDAKGYLYVAGSTSWSGFPTTPGPLGHFNGSEGFSAAEGDVFVQKIEPGTFNLVYSVLIGGSRDEIATGIAVDTQGNAYVTGQTNSNDFPLSPRSSNRSDWDVFVFELNPVGTALLSSRVIGGSGDDYSNAIALGLDGSVTIAGKTVSTDFPVTPGALQGSLTPAGNQFGSGDAFVLRLSQQAGSIQYSTFLGGPGVDYATSLAIDASGDTYVAGAAGPYFPTLASSYSPAQAFGGFVCKISHLTGQLIYSTYLPGTSISQAMVIDTTGNAYVAGSATAGFPSTPGAFQTDIAGGSVDQDAYALELDAAGDNVVFATLIGSSGPDVAYAVALLGNSVVIAGNTSASDFQATDRSMPFCDLDSSYAYTFSEFTPTGAFIAQFDHTGQRLSSSMYSYCTEESATTLAVSASGSLYLTGTALTEQETFYAQVDLAASLASQIYAVADSASYLSGPFAPLQLISIFGKGLGPKTPVQASLTNGVLPTKLAGSQVFLNGQPIPLLFVSDSQINAILPQYAYIGFVDQGGMRVQINNNETEPYSTFFIPANPRLFTNSGLGFGQAAAINQDGSINSPQNPAPRGSVITLFATGGGVTKGTFTDGQVVNQASPLTDQGYFVVGLDFGTVDYSGTAPGLVDGVSQINVTIPTTITPGAAVPVRWALLLEDGDLDFVFSQSGVTIAVK